MPAADPVEAYLAKHSAWEPGLAKLRGVLAKSGLEETVKWGAPCYVHQGRNVVSLAAFKGHFALWFHDARGLEDPLDVLRQAEGGKSERMRHWRFTAAKEVRIKDVRDYVKRAARLSESPRPKPARPSAPRQLPPELLQALKANARARKAFDGLAPGKQREYAEYITEAKRAATKVSRVEKALPRILAGEGLNDHYRRSCSE